MFNLISIRAIQSLKLSMYHKRDTAYALVFGKRVKISQLVNLSTIITKHLHILFGQENEDKQQDDDDADEREDDSNSCYPSSGSLLLCNGIGVLNQKKDLSTANPCDAFQWYFSS